MTRRVPLALGTAAVLALWAFFPDVLLALHAHEDHATWTGADGLIGAHGVLGADQLQYLAWARSIAGHGLAADLFTLGRSAHVYLEPVSGVVGGLLVLGVPLLTGSLLLKGLATLVLAAAALAWARRLEGTRRGAELATVTLALFSVTPAASLVNWLRLGSARFRFDVYLAGDELLSATKLWGYVPAALAVALMPICLLGLERALAGATAATAATGATVTARRPLALAAAAALLCAWLHPWQGITLALIVLALAGVRRTRQEWPWLAVVAVAAALPLAYYAVLAHSDPAWRLAAHNESGPQLPLEVSLLCLGPLLALAALGVRRPGDSLAEQALLLWVPAGLFTYFAGAEFPSHALEGLMLPIAVLAVRGARRVRLPSATGAVCVLALTVPGLAYAARKFVRTSASGLVQYALPRGDTAALRWVHAAAAPGGVLAPTPFAAVIPARTGRAVWVGHGEWSPDYPARAAAADRLFTGQLDPSAARHLVQRTGARLLVADCAHRAAVASELGRLVAATRHFGCARVIVLRAALSPARPPRR